MAFLCYLKHKWGEWQDGYPTDNGFGTQWRKCKRCGEYRKRTVRIDG